MSVNVPYIEHMGQTTASQVGSVKSMCQSACHRYWPKFPSYWGYLHCVFSPLFMLSFFDFDQDEFFGRLCQGLHIQIRFWRGWWEKNCWNVKIAPFLLKVIEPLMFTLMYLLILGMGRFMAWFYWYRHVTCAFSLLVRTFRLWMSLNPPKISKKKLVPNATCPHNMTIQEVWLRNIYILDVDFNSYLFSTLPKTNMDPQINSLEAEFLCNYGDFRSPC